MTLPTGYRGVFFYLKFYTYIILMKGSDIGMAGKIIRTYNGTIIVPTTAIPPGATDSLTITLTDSTGCTATSQISYRERAGVR